MNCSEIKNEELAEQMAYSTFIVILNCLKLLQIYEHFLSRVIYFLNPINTCHKTFLPIIQVFHHQNCYLDRHFIAHNLDFIDHKP